MNLLVTGGAGFIGSNFIRYMLCKHPTYQIINVDALTYAGNLENLNDVKSNPNYSFVKANITDEAKIDTILEHGVDAIVHFAAESHVDRSILNPRAFLKTNIIGTHVLLNAARKHKVSKFVHISTDEVYGSLSETGSFTETTPLASNSPYSASKAGSDLLVRSYHETFSLPINITRCSNNYGPYQFPEKLIPLMVIHALQDKPLPVYGDGLNVRDWIHVEDHCAGIDLVLHKGLDGEIYNIGGNNEWKNIDIVKCILKVLHKSEDLICFVKDRLGHDRRYAIDATKLRTELGWKPKYSFHTGIEQTIQWYLDHKDWWERIQSGAYLDFYKTKHTSRLGDAK